MSRDVMAWLREPLVVTAILGDRGAVQRLELSRTATVQDVPATLFSTQIASGFPGSVRYVARHPQASTPYEVNESFLICDSLT